MNAYACPSSVSATCSVARHAAETELLMEHGPCHVMGAIVSRSTTQAHVPPSSKRHLPTQHNWARVGVVNIVIIHRASSVRFSTGRICTQDTLQMQGAGSCGAWWGWAVGRLPLYLPGSNHVPNGHLASVQVPADVMSRQPMLQLHILQPAAHQQLGQRWDFDFERAPALDHRAAASDTCPQYAHNHAAATHRYIQNIAAARARWIYLGAAALGAVVAEPKRARRYLTPSSRPANHSSSTLHPGMMTCCRRRTKPSSRLPLQTCFVQRSQARNMLVGGIYFQVCTVQRCSECRGVMGQSPAASGRAGPQAQNAPG